MRLFRYGIGSFKFRTSLRSTDAPDGSLSLAESSVEPEPALIVVFKSATTYSGQPFFSCHAAQQELMTHRVMSNITCPAKEVNRRCGISLGAEIKEAGHVISLPFLQTDEAIPYFISSSVLSNRPKVTSRFLRTVTDKLSAHFR